jgi:hypothetical protein
MKNQHPFLLKRIRAGRRREGEAEPGKGIGEGGRE